MAHTAIIMAAPNGARKTKEDHPNIALTIEETVSEAALCFEAGASILHAHVRDRRGRHVLDPSLYQQLFKQMTLQVPNMLVQMTTEAVGLYTPAEQSNCVRDVGPSLISISVREMAGEGSDLLHAKNFYNWCTAHGVHMQHIVYDANDLRHLLSLQHRNVIPEGRLCVLFVLGKFIENREAVPEDIAPFLDAADGVALDWFVCAFGSREHDCALAAIQQGGHARVGFENNLLLRDGSTALHTADLVAELCDAAGESGVRVADSVQTRKLLNIS